MMNQQANQAALGPVPEEFGIGKAVKNLWNGEHIRRRGWDGPSQYLGLHVPDNESGQMMTLPYIYIVTEQGDRVPWLASQTDILATDWIVVVGD